MMWQAKPPNHVINIMNMKFKQSTAQSTEIQAFYNGFIDACQNVGMCIMYMCVCGMCQLYVLRVCQLHWLNGTPEVCSRCTGACLLTDSLVIVISWLTNAIRKKCTLNITCMPHIRPTQKFLIEIILYTTSSQFQTIN